MTTNVTTPLLYALGTLTTAFSFLALVATLVLRRRASAALAKQATTSA
jgi:hypothetical protein